MSLLLRLLLLFAFPHATEPDPGEGDDDAADEDLADDDTGSEDTTEDTTESAAKPDPVAALLEAAQTATREANDKIETLRRQANTRPDPTMDEEERKLRDPATSDLEKWQIQSNRALRTSQQQSQQALFQAQDMADKTTYQVKAASNPVYSKYQDKVEKELDRARASGQNPPREVILQLMIGRDMLAGNFKAAADKAKTIPRGKSPGARSDTPSRGSMTEHQKRAARLANIQI